MNSEGYEYERREGPFFYIVSWEIQKILDVSFLSFSLFQTPNSIEHTSNQYESLTQETNLWEKKNSNSSDLSFRWRFSSVHTKSVKGLYLRSSRSAVDDDFLLYNASHRSKWQDAA